MSTETTETTELQPEKMVLCKVIGDKPVDRVMKGGTVELTEANAAFFVKEELVEIVEIEEPASKPVEEPATKKAAKLPEAKGL